MTAFNWPKAFHSFRATEIPNYTKPIFVEAPSSTAVEERAIVSETIAPFIRGRVRFQGSWWPARCESDVTLLPGEVVQVIGRQNITLLVQPIYRVVSHSVC